jgi:hypothetical protein
MAASRSGSRRAAVTRTISASAVTANHDQSNRNIAEPRCTTKPVSTVRDCHASRHCAADGHGAPTVSSTATGTPASRITSTAKAATRTRRRMNDRTIGPFDQSE